jgi:hypothetical protein
MRLSNYRRNNPVRDIYFPDLYTREDSLENVPGMSLKIKTTHWGITGSRLFKHDPIFSIQYLQLSENSDDSEDQNLTQNFSHSDEAEDNPEKVQGNDNPDTIWIFK